jgi:hypothetical protein
MTRWPRAISSQLRGRPRATGVLALSFFVLRAAFRRLELIGYLIEGIQSEPVCLPSFLELSMP